MASGDLSTWTTIRSPAVHAGDAQGAGEAGRSVGHGAVGQTRLAGNSQEGSVDCPVFHQARGTGIRSPR